MCDKKEKQEKRVFSLPDYRKIKTGKRVGKVKFKQTKENLRLKINKIQAFK